MRDASGRDFASDSQAAVGDLLSELPGTERRAELALLAVIRMAYAQGVNLQKVDDFLRAMGFTGLDKSTVSRICKELDGLVTAFSHGPLGAEYPYLRLDALYLMVPRTIGLCTWRW